MIGDGDNILKEGIFNTGRKTKKHGFDIILINGVKRVRACDCCREEIIFDGIQWTHVERYRDVYHGAVPGYLYKLGTSKKER